MSVKFDQTPIVEPQNIKMTATSTSLSGASPMTGAKASIFSAKAGFVIPKNKLSGSLIPIFKGGKKLGVNDVANEDGTNQVQRKTKWGPDLTQDAAVRRGRALAYQTRVDQIVQQLKSGILDPGENRNLQDSDKLEGQKCYSPQIDTKYSELLELEKRETIGEILKLNPSYKAPPDYKPLLKETTVPIPVKEYPGYNFIGLIFGHGNETLKRLEKETGAKIQVHGTKAHTGEKVEVSPSDGNDMQVAYEELSVLVSADAFEKVDEAAALIELLVTSVSGNLVAGDNANVSQNQEVSSPFMVPAMVNQGVVGPTQTPQPGQFQYQNPWFPAVISQTPPDPHSGTISSQSSSAPILNNPIHSQSTPFNPSTMHVLSGPGPLQTFSNPYQPRNFLMPTPQPPSMQANISASLGSAGSHPQPTGPSSVASGPPGPPSERPPFSGWSRAPASIPGSLVLGNMGQATSIVPSPAPRPVVPQPGFPSPTPPPNAANIVSPITFPSGPSTPQLSSVPMNHPTVTMGFASLPPPQMAPTPIQSSLPVRPVLNPSISPVLVSKPVSLPLMPTSQPSQPTLRSGAVGNFSGTAANFTPIRPSTIMNAQVQHSAESDFAFRPHHLQSPSSQILPRLSNQPAAHPRSMMRPPTTQVPPFRLDVPNSTPQLGMHAFPRPQVGNEMGQTQTHLSALPFVGNHTGLSIPPRVPAFSNASQFAPPVMQLGLRNSSPTPHLPNLAGPLPPRPGNHLLHQQNLMSSIAPRGQSMAQNQPFGKDIYFASGRLTSNPGGQQFYDPFSPTSVPSASQRQGGNLGKGRKQENDPEYEDLMASVGVK